LRVMNLMYANKKKVRGAKRKANQMVRNINELINQFPEVDLEDGYWHMHLPVAQTLIDSTKTPMYIRKLCVQTIINGVKRLIDIRPQTNIPSRVVASVELPHLWYSQIIVFFGDRYFNSFFERDDDYQKWTPLPKGRSLVREWKLNLPVGLDCRGYHEEITAEDFKTVSELWFIGELK